MPEDQKIVFAIRNTQPVELGDLTTSLNCFALEYRKAAGRVGSGGDDVRLFIKEIRTGSIITELVVLAPYALPFLEHTNTIAEFLGHLRAGFGWLLGGSTERPEPLDRNSLTNLAGILDPVAKDRGAQLNIGTVNIEGQVEINISNVEANAVQNAVRREIDRLREPVPSYSEGAVLYFYQTRDDTHSNAGDRGIIERFGQFSVKLHFATEEAKARVLASQENIFRKAFIVDVRVDTIEGRPALYTILRVIDSFPRPEQGRLGTRDDTNDVHTPGRESP